MTSKSAQRKAAQEKVNSVLAGDSSSSSSSASATAGASKVRTANDAKRAIAEVESSECALGMRILSVWCDYIRNIRLAAATPAGSSGTAVTEEEEEMVQDVLQMMFDLASELKGLKTADPIMGAPKSKGKAPETTQERDARQTADLLTELCAELFATTHSNADISDASQVTPHRSRGHGCDRIMQNVLSLEVVLLPFEDWRVEQQNKRKPASSSSASPPPAAVYLQGLLKNFQKECESVLGSWHTLSIGESTLCFLMAQLGALLHRVTQCLGSVQDELSVVTDDLSTGSADVYDVLAPLEDSTALQRIHAHVHRLCQSLLTKLRVTLYPMTHSSKVMNALLNDCSAEAKSSRPVCTSEEGGEGGELEEDQVNSKSGGKGEAAVLRDEYDHLLRTVSAELRRLHNESGGRESGASCGSNSSAGSASRARSSVDEALLELVLDLSIKG